MGAQSFITYAPGRDLTTAFRDAVSDARHEYGHGGYTGTLAEKHEVTVIDRAPRWLDEAYAEAERLLDADDPRVFDKWGPACAIAVRVPTRQLAVALPGGPYPQDSDWKALAAAHVTGTVTDARPQSWTGRGRGMTDVQLSVTVRNDDAGKTKTRQVTVTVDGGRHDRTFNDAVLAAVRRKLRLPADATVGNLRISNERTVTAAARRTGSGRATRWVIVGDHHHDTWAKGFTTLTEAKTRLRQLAAAPAGAWFAPRSYEVQSVTRAADGGPIAAVTVTARRTTVDVTVEVTTGRRSPTTVDGWLLFGIASS